MKITIKVITVGNWKANCYLIAYQNEAWIIDPGEEAENIITQFSLDQLKILGIVNTHGHFDHIGAIAGIQEKYKTPFYIHSNEKRLVHQGNLYRRLAGDFTIVKTPVIDSYLDSLTALPLGDKEIRIHLIPGHTGGSVCFECDGHLFPGDLIFESSIGRADLPGGNKELLQSSVKFLLHHFIGFEIHPGHGKSFILEADYIKNLKTTTQWD